VPRFNMLLVSSFATLALLLSAIGIYGVIAGLTGVMTKLLFGIPARDPLAFGAGAVLLLVVAVLASYIPALRATRVEPVTALRAE